MRYTNDPVADAERYTAEMEEATEASRHRRVVKCTAALWLTVEHATEEEALHEAEEFFREMFSGADDYESRLEEDYA